MERKSIEDFHFWAKQVADGLEGWKYEDAANRGHDGGLLPGVKLTGADGRRILLSQDWNGKQVKVVGRWPDDEDRMQSARDWGAIDFNETEPSIGVGGGREPSAAAKDIARRFLPKYERVWAKVVVKMAERMASRRRLAQKRAALEEFSFVTRDRYNNDPDTSRYNLGKDRDFYGTMEVMDGSVRINLGLLTAEQAERILEVLC